MMMKLSNSLILSLLIHSLIIIPSDSKCPHSFSCGNLTLTFPFTETKNPDCGFFTVDGCDSTQKDPQIQLAGGVRYDLLHVGENNMYVRDTELQKLLKDSSDFALRNVSLSKFPFASLALAPPYLTVFSCKNDPHLVYCKEESSNNMNCSYLTLFYDPMHAPDNLTATAKDLSECSMIQLPIKLSPHKNLRVLLTDEFALEWNVSEDCHKCYLGGGQCISNSINDFYCKKGNRPRKILRIGGMTIVSLASTFIILFIFIKTKHAKEKQEHDRDIELFLKNNGNVAPMRYRYSAITKMTKSFSVQLGKGGFGSVYKGKFPEGRLVAVKVLNESNGNGEDFMNEVASISRTSHVNIVALLGYCFEGSKRALIYDFMPYGSLEKFIDNNTASSPAESVLGWEKLFEIALGVARGLEYLHQGCSTRILHLDIKPQNILLDKDLNPRISDFGLAKLCPNRSSVVSMLGARGTIGYVAPEVFSRNFGEVSYKSDVYSYGMLVLEMVGGRRDIDRRDVDRTSEIYFPHYIYKELEMDAKRDGHLSEIMHDEDESQLVKRNLMVVGLWCVQTNPKDRPSMTKVVGMLEAKHGLLEVPPKPYLPSPPRPAPNFSTSESESLSL